MDALTVLAGNGIWSLGTILVIIVILLLAVKKGWIGFKGHGLTVGDGGERVLIRNQWEYVKAACEGQFKRIRPYCKSDEHAKYVIARVEDVFQDMCVHNFITDEECYVRAKKNLVLMTIQKRVDNDHFFSPDFRACCDKFVEDLIKDLYHMKRVMS